VSHLIHDSLSQDARTEFDREILDHGKLVGMLQELESWLEIPPDHFGAWTETLSGRLTDVVIALRSHFKREEDSPLFREVPINFPRFSGTIDRLMSEHGQFLNDLDEIIDSLESLRQPRQAHIWEMACKTKLVVASLRRHESEENEVLQKAYWEDVGGMD